MAAATAHEWALVAHPAARIVGDILASPAGGLAAPRLFISPSQFPTPRRGAQLSDNLLTTGAHVCAIHGGVQLAPHKAAMVVALAAMQYFRGPIETTWSGRSLRLELMPLRGAMWQACIAAERAQHGAFCGEWLPYTILSSLRLFTELGTIVNPNTRYRAICRLGVLLKDIVHWRWSSTDDLLITALCRRVTPGTRMPIGHLMTLLVLNFPTLMERGTHSDGVRYGLHNVTNPTPSLWVNSDGYLCGASPDATKSLFDRPTLNHRHLTDQLRTSLGVTAKSLRVHPHPRISRLVCLWAGNRRWSGSNKGYKTKLSVRAQTSALKKRAAARGHWQRLSADAAKGLDRVHWASIRRIVGLNPWGEQLLLRIKHHALSVYNPIAAGLGCPHTDCVRKDQVDLHHIFWTCPAAHQLRHILLSRWQAAGLRLASHEEAIFSLTLPTPPSRLTMEIGQVLAEQDDATITAVGDSTDKIIEGCWRLGAASYLLAFWRWRVAHFHHRNDTTAPHHTKDLASRLRAGYANLATSFPPAMTARMKKLLGRLICRHLSTPWDGRLTGQASPDTYTVVFFGGDTKGPLTAGGSGTLIVAASIATGQFDIKYLSGTTLGGQKVDTPLAAHLGLLKGLKICHQYGWKQVHVVSDHNNILRQHGTRTPPRAKHLRGPYWTAKRLADAVEIRKWQMQARENNATTHAIARAARTTGAHVEWNAHTIPTVGTKWDAISGRAAADVEPWLAAWTEPSCSQLATATV